MELKIYSPTADGFVKEISWNHEDIKKEVAEKVKMYTELVYTENQLKEMKADRAKLNKFVQALEAKRKEVKKQCLAPYENFEQQVKEIVAIVNEPISLIDSQIKAVDEQRKAEKLEEIKKAWEIIQKPDWLTFEQIFNSKWLNSTVALPKVHAELEERVKAINTDLATLSKLPEYGFEATEVYKTTLDIGKAIQEGHKLSEMAKRKAELEKQLAEAKETLEAAVEIQKNFGLDSLKIPDGTDSNTVPVVGVITVEESKELAEQVENLIEKQWISFKANLSPMDAAALREFFESRKIEFAPVTFDKEKATKIMCDILCYAYCDNCRNADDTDRCDFCHRKYQNWGLDEGTAEEIAVIIEKECL